VALTARDRYASHLIIVADHWPTEVGPCLTACLGERVEHHIARLRVTDKDFKTFQTDRQTDVLDNMELVKKADKGHDPSLMVKRRTMSRHIEIDVLPGLCFVLCCNVARHVV